MASPALEATRQVCSESTLLEIETGALEGASADEILTWSIKNFHPRLALSASFGAPEGMVLFHMMHELEETSRVFVIDTGRLPQETHDLVDRMRERYDKPVEVLFPAAESVAALTREQGMNGFYESPDRRRACCRVRKVEPLRRYLVDLDGYVTGLRREQNENRRNAPKVEVDGANGGVVKINPLADWTQEEVLAYVRRNDIPVNRLHVQGYPSVGCGPCTRAVPRGEDPRSGRWWWEDDKIKECGLHLSDEEQGSGI